MDESASASSMVLKFCSQVTERSLLIIHDGHLSHISMLLIEKAWEEDITILKLSPYVMDKIHSLDVSGFGPLKRAWTELLKERMDVLGCTYHKAHLSICFLKYVFQKPTLKSLEQLEFFQLIRWNVTQKALTNNLSTMDWVRETSKL